MQMKTTKQTNKEQKHLHGFTKPFVQICLIFQVRRKPWYSPKLLYS